MDKFLVSLFTNKGFGFHIEVGVSPMLDVIIQRVVFLLTNNRSHSSRYLSNQHFTSKSQTSQDLESKSK